MEKTTMTNKKKSLHIKNSDRVMIIAGKDKGKDGNIKKVNTADGTVLVEGLNMVTKAQKPQPALGIQGGLIKVEAPLDSSNVMIICPACSKATRPARKIVDGKKVRVCKKCGEQL
jgi:large subunit ribosomal protein L24